MGRGGREGVLVVSGGPLARDGLSESLSSDDGVTDVVDSQSSSQSDSQCSFCSRHKGKKVRPFTTGRGGKANCNRVWRTAVVRERTVR